MKQCISLNYSKLILIRNPACSASSVCSLPRYLAPGTTNRVKRRKRRPWRKGVAGGGDRKGTARSHLYSEGQPARDVPCIMHDTTLLNARPNCSRSIWNFAAACLVHALQMLIPLSPQLTRDDFGSDRDRRLFLFFFFFAETTKIVSINSVKQWNSFAITNIFEMWLLREKSRTIRAYVWKMYRYNARWWRTCTETIDITFDNGTARTHGLSIVLLNTHESYLTTLPPAWNFVLAYVPAIKCCNTLYQTPCRP